MAVSGASPTLSVVVPVYNELDNVRPLVERVRNGLEGTGHTWELIAVDDGSTDGSGARLDELAVAEPRLRVLHFETNCGQSAGLDAGFRHARGGLVALLDADLQTFPEDLPLLITTLETDGVDAVVGIRADRHDGGWRKFSSRFANSVRNRLTREDIVDTGCPIKVFRADAVARIPRFNGMHRFLPTLLRMEGCTVTQVPVRHAPRQHGSSKYGTWDRAFRGLRDALGVRWLQDRHLDWKLR
jgi:glycosyltransferase involved in cell wall biosynthesis